MMMIGTPRQQDPYRPGGTGVTTGPRGRRHPPRGLPLPGTSPPPHFWDPHGTITPRLANFFAFPSLALPPNSLPSFTSRLALKIINRIYVFFVFGVCPGRRIFRNWVLNKNLPNF